MDINAKLLEKKKKKNHISLNISKYFPTIFDYRLDLIKAHYQGTFERDNETDISKTHLNKT